jgi:type VI secretion system secreted protein VgrG
MAYTQEERICRVSSPLGDDVLLLTGMNAVESLSNPFYFDMHFLSQTEDIDFAAVVGKPLCVHLTLGNGNERYFHGIVSRFSQGSPEGGFASYRAEVVPWISLLRRRAGCRIFQHKTVPDIIKAVLAETGFGDVEFPPPDDFSEREYCVQYRETDLNFISRLAEEEGISYFFRHSEKQHTLVFFNSPSAATPCPGQSAVPYASAVDLSVLGGSISDFRVEHELASGKYSITDYNFEDPSMSLLATTQSSTTLGGNEKFEIYDYPGEYLQLSEGERRVKLRMQAEEAAAIRIHAHSDCGAFVPGYRFDLQGHFRDSYNKSYLITEVNHQVSQSIATAGAGGGSGYANSFSCIPHSVPFRPQRLTPKPLITGVQTATVVGAAGKEIDVDAHGRVIVQFHWDREGTKNESSSCRVRVAQNWAGKNWGMISNPRIGQEVVVEFVEGDPDRPIIIGSVYNGEQTVPYELPISATQTGIKSRSSMEGASANFNEIRFEDKKGEEQLFFHAEKNQDIEVENDETHWVGHDRAKKVDNDETVTIGRDRTQTIVRNKTESVGANKDIIVNGGHVERIDGGMTITVGGSFGHQVLINYGATVGGAMEMTAGGLIAITAGAALAEQVGGGKSEAVGISKTLTVGSNLDETIGNDRTTDVKKNAKLKVGKNDEIEVDEEYRLKAKKIQLVAEEQFSLKVGKSEILLKSGGDVVIKGGKLTFEGSGDVILKGKQIKEN